MRSDALQIQRNCVLGSGRCDEVYAMAREKKTGKGLPCFGPRLQRPVSTLESYCVFSLSLAAQASCNGISRP